MAARNLKLTQTGQEALGKSPGDRTAKQRRQAKTAERAIGRREEIRKAKAADDKKRINDGLRRLSKLCVNYTGIKRLAYRVKLFWLIPDTKPKKFYPPNYPIELAEFELLKAATIALINQCVVDYEYGDQAIAVWTYLDNPPARTRRTLIASYCRELADSVISTVR